jgi:hypothetical protein
MPPPSAVSRALRAASSVRARIALASSRKPRPARVSVTARVVEQPDADLVLQRLDEPGEGGGRHMQAFRRATEMHGVGDGDEAAELLQVHGRAMELDCCIGVVRPSRRPLRGSSG